MDEPIEDEGKAEASAMAGQLDRASEVYAGPEHRVAQSVSALRLVSTVVPDLRECNYGRWSGRSLKDLEIAEPDALVAWLSDVNATPHGGESLANVAQRVAAWLDKLAKGNGRVVAVSHSSVIRAAIIHAIGAPVATFWRIDVAPLSRTHMSHDGRQWKLQAVR